LERRLAKQVLLESWVRQEPQEQRVLRRLVLLQQVLVERPMRWKCFPNRRRFRSCYMEQQLGKRQRFRHNHNPRLVLVRKLVLGRKLVLVHCRMLRRPSIEQPS